MWGTAFPIQPWATEPQQHPFHLWTTISASLASCRAQTTFHSLPRTCNKNLLTLWRFFFPLCFKATPTQSWGKNISDTPFAHQHQGIWSEICQVEVIAAIWMLTQQKWAYAHTKGQPNPRCISPISKTQTTWQTKKICLLQNLELPK